MKHKKGSRVKLAATYTVGMGSPLEQAMGLLDEQSLGGPSTRDLLILGALARQHGFVFGMDAGGELMLSRPSSAKATWRLSAPNDRGGMSSDSSILDSDELQGRTEAQTVSSGSGGQTQYSEKRNNALLPSSDESSVKEFRNYVSVKSPHHVGVTSTEKHVQSIVEATENPTGRLDRDAKPIAIQSSSRAERKPVPLTSNPLDIGISQTDDSQSQSDDEQDQDDELEGERLLEKAFSM